MKNYVNEYFNSFYRKMDITQKKFCEMTGIPEGSIKNMKTRGTNPSMATIQKIKAVFPDFDIIPSGNDMVTDYRELYYNAVAEANAKEAEITGLLRENRILNHENRELRDELDEYKNNSVQKQRSDSRSA